MPEWLSYEFMQNALLAGVLASVLCGVIGTYVVVKRLVFIGGGLSHAAFGGLGICYFFGLNPLFGGVVVSVAAALLLGSMSEKQVESPDAMIGVLWAVGTAVGIIFIYETPGYAPNLMTYLFGNVLTVTRTDLLLSLALNVVVLLVLGLFSKEFVAVVFDEPFAAVQGVRVRAVMMVLLTLVALTVVLLIQVVGIVLVIALLTIPPLVGLRVARTFFGVQCVAIGLGLVMTLTGLAVSYRWDVPSGPAMILVGAAVLLGLAAWQSVAQKVRRG